MASASRASGQRFTPAKIYAAFEVCAARYGVGQGIQLKFAPAELIRRGCTAILVRMHHVARSRRTAVRYYFKAGVSNFLYRHVSPLTGWMKLQPFRLAPGRGDN